MCVAGPEERQPQANSFGEVKANRDIGANVSDVGKLVCREGILQKMKLN